jgi:hypothetical protein
MKTNPTKLTEENTVKVTLDCPLNFEFAITNFRWQHVCAEIICFEIFVLLVPIVL